MREPELCELFTNILIPKESFMVHIILVHGSHFSREPVVHTLLKHQKGDGFSDRISTE
jgi:hypothetical protein